MSDVESNLDSVKMRIKAACMLAGRDHDSVELIAVSKTVSPEIIRDAVNAGQRVFGESKLQEAESKIASLPGSLCWHFIGGLQRNKIRKILGLFDVLHAIDSMRLAQYADGVALELGLFPKVFIQVNIGGEKTKGGFEIDEIESEIDGLLSLKRLQVIGLMSIPPPGPDAESSRPWFKALADLRNSLQQRTGVQMPSLSMGMSDDFEIAIQEGATHVRVGSSIFGKRSYRVDGELG
jgi:pyridoxal phosphate enzyme (YggS family)